MTETTVSAALIAAARERADELIEESHGLDGESAGNSALDSDAELFVALAADLAQSERELAVQAATIEAVKALHVPVRRYQVLGVDERSFDSAEKAADSAEDAAEWLDDDDDDGVTFFEVCVECGRIESDQLRWYGEEWSYRESLWPCPTAAILDRTVTTEQPEGENRG